MVQAKDEHQVKSGNANKLFSFEESDMDDITEHNESEENDSIKEDIEKD